MSVGDTGEEESTQREPKSDGACKCICCGFGFSIGRPCGIVFCCIPCMC